MEGGNQSSRVAVFVDGANLYHAIKSYYKGVLDYSRLLEAAVGDRSLLRATFYIVEKQEADGERTVSHKGDWDVGIVVDMMRLAAHADAYVLVSGDGDYVEAVEYLQSERGLRVEVISAAQCTSQALLDVCDRHTDLADIPDLFRRPSKQAVSPQQPAIS